MDKEIVIFDSCEPEAFWDSLGTECRIVLAENGSNGLEAISQNTLLAVVPLQLPDMSGIDALSEIKKRNAGAAVMITASCGGGEPCRCMEAFRRGAWDYVKKPFRAEELKRKIRTLLQPASPAAAHPAATQQVSEAYPDIPPQFVRRIMKVKDYLEENYSESLTLAAACKMAMLSKTYFCKFFKSITGKSLTSYHHYIKIQIAQELLADPNLSVTEVAIRLGYDDANYFSTIYKKITGVSPRCTKQAAAETADALSHAPVPDGHKHAVVRH